MRKAVESRRTSALSPIVSIVGGLAALSTLLVMFGLSEVRNATPQEPRSAGRIAGVVTDRSGPGVGLDAPTTTTVPPELPLVPIPDVRAIAAVVTTPTTAAPTPAPSAPVVAEPAAVVVASVQAEAPAVTKKDRGKHRAHQPHDPHQPKHERGSRDAQQAAAAADALAAAPAAADPVGDGDQRGRQPHKSHTPHQSRRDRTDGPSAQEEDCTDNAANDA